jgi:hypothetical protein
VNVTTTSWTLVLFFGGALMFAGIRRLTEDQGAGVTLAVQGAALVLVIAAIVLVVRRLGDGDRDGDGE